jgi:hypothetical protein
MEAITNTAHPRVRSNAKPVSRPQVGRRYFVTVDGQPLSAPETPGAPGALSYHGVINGTHVLNHPNTRYVDADRAVLFFSVRDAA